MPLLLRIGLVLAVMLIGGVAAVILFPRRTTLGEGDEEDESGRRQRLATEHDTAASAGFQTALDACRGLPARLTRIAEAAEAKAAASATGKTQDSSPRHTA